MSNIPVIMFVAGAMLPAVIITIFVVAMFFWRCLKPILKYIFLEDNI